MGWLLIGARWPFIYMSTLPKDSPPRAGADEMGSHHQLPSMWQLALPPTVPLHGVVSPIRRFGSGVEVFAAYHQPNGGGADYELANSIPPSFLGEEAGPRPHGLIQEPEPEPGLDSSNID